MLSYAQSQLSGDSLENVFFNTSERLQVTFGNLNKYSEKLQSVC